MNWVLIVCAASSMTGVCWNEQRYNYPTEESCYRAKTALVFTQSQNGSVKSGNYSLCVPKEKK
jgi:hypothetical protein